MGQTRRDLLVHGWAIGAVLVATIARSGQGGEPARAGAEGPRLKGRSAEEAKWEAWWGDLEKSEEQATRALLNMADHPAQAVPFLNDKLKPLTITPERLHDLLNWLGSDDEDVWMTAFEELEYFDPRLAIGLEKLMDDVTKSPTRQRLVEVLSGREAGSLAGKVVNLRAIGGGQGFNFFTNPGGSWWAEDKIGRLNSLTWLNIKKKWTRAVRAIVLLEHLGTPESVAILKAMATGNPEAQPTRAARDALTRLEKAKVARD